jgi:hypothetical protein
LCLCFAATAYTSLGVFGAAVRTDTTMLAPQFAWALLVVLLFFSAIYGRSLSVAIIIESVVLAACVVVIAQNTDVAAARATAQFYAQLLTEHVAS